MRENMIKMHYSSLDKNFEAAILKKIPSISIMKGLKNIMKNIFPQLNTRENG